MAGAVGEVVLKLDISILLELRSVFVAYRWLGVGSTMSRWKGVLWI